MPGELGEAAAALRGHPGTKAVLPSGRAVGTPLQLGLFAAFAAVALAAWLAAAIVLLLAAPDLAARDPLALRPVLAAHLVALGLLPFAVTAASFHLMPMMLRNETRRPQLVRAALPLLGGAFLAAPGIALDRPGLLWPGVGLLSLGLALVLAELLGHVGRAPGDRTLVVSRTGVALVALNVVAALVLGALLFAHGDEPFGGVVHDRWLLVHLHLAVLGWLTLLIVTVGRTLGPMLALAPVARPRRAPLPEVALALGLWLLAAGIAASSDALALAGAAVVLAALAGFGALVVRVARTRRLAVEGPLAHLVAGVVFLAEAAVLGIATLAGSVSAQRALTAYVLLLLLGWAGGVTLGHLGKLLSLSAWAWWPPGPRPKQELLYPRPVWVAEAAAFAAGVQLAAAGSLAGSQAATYAGGALLLAAAALAAAGAAVTWSRRAR